MTRVKICGITRLDDAVAAVDAGADAIGFVFVPSSPRFVAADRARAIGDALQAGTLKVGVFMDAPRDEVQRTARDAQLDVIQLHGNESPAECDGYDRTVWKRFRIVEDQAADALRAETLPYRVDACLLDPGEGSGQTFRWEVACGIEAPLIVAGGLTSENVTQAMRLSRAWGVDVSSGVESAPGKKDPVLMRRFIEAVRQEDQRHAT
jgi:phosphoribosylanthranilate isomerase